MDKLEKAQGCLLGAAYGDSMGAAVEFWTADRICKKYPRGLTEPLGYCGLGTISDDTQQALAVCRGLIHGFRRGSQERMLLDDIYSELRRWLATQDEPSENRAPGATSLSALMGGIPGSIQKPVNDSKSCGAVMRAHPIGIAFTGDRVQAFLMGSKIGALTHGHIDGYTPSGVLAAIVAEIMGGSEIKEAVKKSLETLERLAPKAKSTAYWLYRALIQKPGSDIGLNGRALGWDGDEALAMGVYGALSFPDDLVKACSFASIHDGDSDSVASITGSLVGAALGRSAIPKPWDEKLEHALELRQRAEELLSLRR